MNIFRSSTCSKTGQIWMLSGSECTVSLAAAWIGSNIAITCFKTTFFCSKLASSLPTITDFEICVLANLAPGDAEEAKLMVPSLAVSHTIYMSWMQASTSYACSPKAVKGMAGLCSHQACIY